MDIEKYSLSFTSATILRQETVLIAKLYLRIGDWAEVRNQVISENLLQSRTLNTSKRLCREIISRLKTCSLQELKFMVDSTLEEQEHLVWLAICRRYRFIGDFSAEVLREQCANFRLFLDYGDFDAFFNRKAEWHDELEKVKPSTKIKLRQFLFRMLREVGFLAEDGSVKPVMLSPSLLMFMSRNDYEDIRFFPILDSYLVQQN
jgi:hypothetical protein